ncbi:hypothetical protein SPWS13_2852 [Shewanella putrefaciens]|nr:hypothetical protein SPWS13_2852 [Shewanella putrefaciens]
MKLQGEKQVWRKSANDWRDSSNNKVINVNLGGNLQNHPECPKLKPSARMQDRI